VAQGTNENGQKNTEGRVTSTYYSPTLNKGIAMGLVKHGPARMGQVVEMNKVDGSTVKARIVDPVFFDKAGEKPNV
jgi:sarcosine oxidase subunit alpha